MQANYLESVRKQFAYYKMLGDRTFVQLADEELFWQYQPESNSIAIIVSHLWGNMRSRWTDFLTTDGEKTWRDREAEFADSVRTRAELLDKWEAGWACLFGALDTLHADNLDTIVYIRNMGHTVVEAINRQLAHYAYHVGQITYLGRMQRGSGWQSLSIPKGDSQAYNAQQFAQPRRRAHFTQQFLRDE